MDSCLRALNPLLKNPFSRNLKGGQQWALRGCMLPEAWVLGPTRWWRLLKAEVWGHTPPQCHKNKVLLASPWGGKLPTCHQLAGTHCTFSPQFHTRAEVVQLPFQYPLPSRHCCERLLGTVCYTSALHHCEKNSKQGSKLRSGNMSELGKCREKMCKGNWESETTATTKMADVPDRADTGETRGGPG